MNYKHLTINERTCIYQFKKLGNEYINLFDNLYDQNNLNNENNIGGKTR